MTDDIAAAAFAADDGDKPMWIIADDYNDEGNTFVVQGFGKHETATGKEVPIMRLHGIVDETKGLFNVSKWSVRIDDSMRTAHGDNPVNWIGKQVMVERKGRKLLIKNASPAVEDVPK